ncbi:IS66 family transposase [Pseudobacteriovorax antillogorgiicola]|uniref:Transposase IS66 family protein n=1 Tax=Pseudobacteriovorax antillogorgiicola TaxID=1513793 RepID=A0A1Y6CQR9_9BACT|nr:transposase [Pseudobacteriovorax antillogorgiicola]TCS41182.1 transposase IS66 family protein [Pseudobacteriovorax antillogorgiicola]SMF83873.1 Transposase IS66 family protein [Pseudobacteriovorax antillogorgiicola]
MAESAKTVDDSGDKVKVTKCTRNALANAVVACLRFMFGIPFYRLAKIQDSLGIGLPEANQYAMVAQVYEAALPIYEQLIFEAAQGSLVMADDTAIKILDWLRGKGPPTKTTGEPRKTAQTSAVVSRSAEGRCIVLYLTGEKQAGKTLKKY